MFIMFRLLTVIAIGTLLSGCMKTNSYYPRAYGEDWKVYPFVEGSAVRAGIEGRKCWAEENRANWDQCY